MFRSYDIFDTCLKRHCESPYNVFLILAQRLMPNKDKSWHKDFALDRIRAEESARMNSSFEEITLDDIYASFRPSSYVSITNEEILQLEISLEKEQLYANEIIREEINHYRAAGDTIAYISDTYLPEKFVREVLMELGFLLGDDLLFVSSSLRLTKERGSIFTYVQNRLRIPIKNWHHTGDNLLSDFNVPSRLGIHCHLLPQLIIPSSIAPDRGNDLVSDLIAPFWVMFTHIVLKEANRRGISRLYFLARDGYAMYCIAQVIQSQYPNVEVHYLYVSRKALYLPGLSEFTVNTLRNAIASAIGSTLQIALDVWQIGDDFLSESERTLLITKDNQESCTLHLLNRGIIEYVNSKIQHSCSLVQSYFRQEGLYDDILCGIVDVRGTRFSHEQINNILTSSGGRAVYGFYFEVFETRRTIPMAGEYYSWLYDEDRDVVTETIKSHPDLIEQVFATTSQHRTVGYEMIDNYVVPLTEFSKINSDRELFAQEIISKSISFARYYDIEKNPTLYADFFRLLQSICSFIKYPNREHLKPLGGYVLSETKYDQCMYVRKYHLYDWAQLAIFSKRLKNTNWFLGDLIYNIGYCYGRKYYTLYTFLHYLKNRIKRYVILNKNQTKII